MIIAATLSLAIAFLARRLKVRVEDIRALSRDPRWIAAALLMAVGLALAIHLLVLRAG